MHHSQTLISSPLASLLVYFNITYIKIHCELRLDTRILHFTHIYGGHIFCCDSCTKNEKKVVEEMVPFCFDCAPYSLLVESALKLLGVRLHQ